MNSARRLLSILGAASCGIALASAVPIPSGHEPIVSHIPRQHVQSTAIANVGYSKRRHILEIEFVNGAIYRYLDVSPSVYRDMIKAESKARYYLAYIKGNYQSIRIRSWQEEAQN
jgi:hypothetical protein